jgi:hypothetical protein
LNLCGNKLTSGQLDAMFAFGQALDIKIIR